jgi:hypothetical protein
MYSNRGMSFILANDKASARTMLEQAAAAAGDLNDLELLTIPSNSLQLEGDPTAYATGLRAIYERVSSALGPGHPDALAHRMLLAMLEPDGGTALEAMLATCAAYMAWKDIASARICAFEAAMLAIDAGDTAAATAAMRDVVARTPSDPVVLGVRWMLGAVTGTDLRTEAAEAYLARDPGERAIYVTRIIYMIPLRGDSPWTRQEAVDALVVLGDWTRASALARPEEQPAYYTRRHAQLRRGLALAIATSDPARARSLAQEARAFYARDSSAVAARKELDSIVTERKSH